MTFNGVDRRGTGWFGSSVVAEHDSSLVTSRIEIGARGSTHTPFDSLPMADNQAIGQAIPQSPRPAEIESRTRIEHGRGGHRAGLVSPHVKQTLPNSPPAEAQMLLRKQLALHPGWPGAHARRRRRRRPGRRAKLQL